MSTQDLEGIRRLGKYVLGPRLGQGGMGVVYEAEDTLLKRRVAVKLLTEALTADADALRGFQREARAAARLNHPHVVTIHEVDHDHDIWYLVMELLPGGSVQDALTARGVLPWPEATLAAADACRGLAAAHAAGLLHRDVKPGNLLRGPDGRVKLGDFGLACTGPGGGASITGMGRRGGTPRYMSPEQCRGETLDPRSDLYSLGATYYALLTGRPPFEEDDPLKVMFAHCSAAVPDPRAFCPAVPEACARLVQQAMAKYPAERHGSAAAMLAALEGLLAPATDGSAVEMTARGAVLPPPPGAAPRHRAARRPLPTAARWLAVLTGAAVLAVLAVLLFRGVPGPDPGARPGPPLAARPPTPRAEYPDAVTAKGRRLRLDGDVRSVAFSPDGRWFAAGSLNRQTRDGHGGCFVWPRTPGAAGVAPLSRQTVRWVGFSRDGSTLAVCADAGTVILLDPASGHGRGQQLPRAEDTWVGCAAYTPGGLFHVAGVARNGSRVSWWKLGRTGEWTDGAVATDGARPLAFSADAGTLAWSGKNGRVHRLDLATGKEQETFRGDGEVTALAFSHDGKTLAVGAPGRIELWDLKSLALSARLQLPSRESEVQGLAFSPDGTRLASSGDQQARLWHLPADTEPGAKGRPLDGHSGRVVAVAFSPDGQLLATASYDQSVILWDVSHLQSPRTRALEALRKLGAKVKVAPDRPGKVVEVSLIGARVADADLTHLQALPALQRLELNSPEVTDRGLAHLKDSTRLRWLALNGTQVSGAGLTNLTGMTELTYLWLSGAKNVTDAGLEHLAGLKKLGTVDLRGTAVRGPGLVHLANLPNLTTLNLGTPEFTDEGMPQVAAFTRLMALDLGKAGVTDRGLRHLKALRFLEVLTLDGTKVTDAGLADLVAVPRLTHLSLRNTAVSNSGLKAFKDAVRFRELGLGCTAVGDDGLRHLAGLSELDTLDLEGTEVTDEGLVHLKGLGKLRFLVLGKTAVGDAGMAHVGRLKELRTLQLAGTQVGDEGLKQLAGLEWLEYLSLRGSRVTAAGLRHLEGLARLRTLHLPEGFPAPAIEALRKALPQVKIH